MVASTWGAPQRYSRRYNVDDYIYGDRQTPSPQPTEDSFESFQSPSMTYTIFRGAPRFVKTKQGKCKNISNWMQSFVLLVFPTHTIAFTSNVA